MCTDVSELWNRLERQGYGYACICMRMRLQSASNGGRHSPIGLANAHRDGSFAIPKAFHKRTNFNQDRFRPSRTNLKPEGENWSFQESSELWKYVPLCSAMEVPWNWHQSWSKFVPLWKTFGTATLPVYLPFFWVVICPENAEKTPKRSFLRPFRLS